MSTKFFFRWTFKFAEAEATEKTAVSVSTTTINHGLMAKRFSALFLS